MSPVVHKAIAKPSSLLADTVYILNTRLEVDGYVKKYTELYLQEMHALEFFCGLIHQPYLSVQTVHVLSETAHNA